MITLHTGSAVPRYQIFVLDDGNYVIQWTEKSVQDLMSGEYREYKFTNFGHRINDHELDRLKKSGVIEDYDQSYVWVYALPEDNRFGNLRTIQQTFNQTRSYYINTTLISDRLEEVQSSLQVLDLDEDYSVCEHEGLVAILGKDTMPFGSLRDAENAQRQLQAHLPELLENAAVAFSEKASEFGIDTPADEEEFIDLDALIASQTDTRVTQGKYAVVACKDEDERQTIMHLLSTMQMAVVGAATAQEALNRLEEEPVDVLVMDLHLDDMHGWAMLGKLREIDHSDRTRIIALAEQGAGDQVFALTVAKVDVYLHKPVSMARLRQSIWSVFKEQSVE